MAAKYNLVPSSVSTYEPMRIRGFWLGTSPGVKRLTLALTASNRMSLGPHMQLVVYWLFRVAAVHFRDPMQQYHYASLTPPEKPVISTGNLAIKT